MSAIGCQEVSDGDVQESMSEDIQRVIICKMSLEVFE